MRHRVAFIARSASPTAPLQPPSPTHTTRPTEVLPPRRRTMRHGPAAPRERPGSGCRIPAVPAPALPAVRPGRPRAQRNPFAGAHIRMTSASPRPNCIAASGDKGGSRATKRNQPQPGNATRMGSSAGPDWISSRTAWGRATSVNNFGSKSSKPAFANTISGDALLTMWLTWAGSAWQPESPLPSPETAIPRIAPVQR